MTTSGNYFTSGVYNLSWSIGEVVTATHSSGTSKITQGFHQPPLRVTAIGDSINAYFQIYPNPTTGTVTVICQNNDETTEYYLTDILGKELLCQRVENEKKIVIDLSQFPSGIYLLSLKHKNQKENSIFKIQKTD